MYKIMLGLASPVQNYSVNTTLRWLIYYILQKLGLRCFINSDKISGERVVKHPTGSQEQHKNVRNPPRNSRTQERWYSNEGERKQAMTGYICEEGNEKADRRACEDGGIFRTPLVWQESFCDLGDAFFKKELKRMITTERDKLRMLTKGLRTRKFRKAGTSKKSERA